MKAIISVARSMPGDTPDRGTRYAAHSQDGYYLFGACESREVAVRIARERGYEVDE